MLRPWSCAFGLTALRNELMLFTRLCDNLRSRDTDGESEKDVGHHHLQAKDLEESDEKVGINTVGNDDFLIRHRENCLPPCEHSRRERSGFLGIRGENGSRLEDLGELLTSVKDKPDSSEDSDSDTGGNERRYERGCRLGLRIISSRRHDCCQFDLWHGSRV